MILLMERMQNRMHTPSNLEYLQDEYRKRGEPIPKIRAALCEINFLWGGEDRRAAINGEDIYDLLVKLSQSIEFYAAKNKPEVEWDEYDYMMLPTWKRLQELLERE